MKIIKSIFLIINYKTFIVTILALLSTYLCREYGIKADFPLTILGIAIVFPVVFSIDSAYKRRERTLMYLSDFKAHVYAIYLASRDWTKGDNLEIKDEIKQQLTGCYESLRDLCSKEKSFEKFEEDVYASISALSQVIQKFRAQDMYLGEVSRINQYLSKLSIDVENIKVIRQYRTPITLRAYSKVFIFSFPIIYGPYFVYAGQNYTAGLEYFMPVVFSFILVSLDNIQVHLENPFDQLGEDDVKFDVEEFAAKLK